MDEIQLHILSPEGTLVKKAVSLVTLPGVVSPFTVLKDHAALVTALVEGDIRYVANDKEERLHMSAEDQERMTVCIRADRGTPMRLLGEVKQQLRDAYALNVTYSAMQK